MEHVCAGCGNELPEALAECPTCNSDDLGPGLIDRSRVAALDYLRRVMMLGFALLMLGYALFIKARDYAPDGIASLPVVNMAFYGLGLGVFVWLAIVTVQDLIAVFRR